MISALVMIVGSSGSGKTTLETNLVTHWPETYEKETSATTREPREEEKDGIDYYFVTPEKFEALDLIEHATFGGHQYGMTSAEFHKTNLALVSVIELIGARAIRDYIAQKDLPVPVIVIRFSIPEDVRRQNMLKRGDNPIKVEERLAGDFINVAFSDYGLDKDCEIIEITELTPDLHEILHNSIQNLLGECHP